MVKFIAPSPVVFLIDDDVHILKALERILSCTDYLVQCYTSAEQFITVANLRQPALHRARHVHARHARLGIAGISAAQ